MKISTIFILVRAFFSGSSFKEIFSMGASRTTRKSNKILSKAAKLVVSILIWICIGIAIASFMVMFGFTYYTLESLGQAMDFGPGLSVLFSLVASGLMLFIFGFMMSIDTLYKGRDLSFLRTLPVRESEIISSRILIMLTYLLPVHLLMVLPSLVINYIMYPFAVSTITGSLIILFVYPMIPIAICCLLSMVTCRLGGKGPGKLAVQIVLFIGMIMMMSIFQVNAMESFSAEMTLDQMSSMGGIIGFLSGNLNSILKYLPVFLWFQRSLTGQPALLDSVLSIAAGIGFFALAAVLMSRSYTAIASSMEGGAKSSRKKAKAENPKFQSRSAVATLAIREWEVLKSSSSFLFEILGECCIPLILILVWGVMGSLGEITQMVDSIKDASFFPLIVCAVLMFFEGFCMISSTSASREGKYFEVNRTYPLDGTVFLNAKLLVHMLAVWVPNVIYALIAVIMFRLPWWHFLWIAALNFVFCLITGYQGLAIDLNKPMLTWKNPQQAVKQNTNGLKSMGLCIFEMLVVGGGFVALYLLVGIWAGIIWLCISLAGLLVLLKGIACRIARNTYNVGI